MKNRFNISEEEKNRIKSLHSIKLINEQWTEVEMEGEPQEGVNTIGGGSGFVGDQGGSDALSKFQKRQEVGEQSRNTDRVKSTDSGSAKDNEAAHEEFMTSLCKMDIVAMGDKSVGCKGKKCDGNKTDGSGGCYGPLIKLIQQYCKTK